MTDKLRDDLAEVVRQMRSIAEPNDHLLNSWANTIECHHAQIQRNVEDAATLKRLVLMRNQWERDESVHLNQFGQHLPASVACLIEHFDKAMRANGGEVES